MRFIAFLSRTVNNVSKFTAFIFCFVLAIQESARSVIDSSCEFLSRNKN